MIHDAKPPSNDEAHPPDPSDAPANGTSLPSGPPRHDPDVCGLDGAGCPGCAAEASARSDTVRGLDSVLAATLERFGRADERLRRAATVEDREAAEDERQAAQGEFFAAEQLLAQVGLLLVRFMRRHEPDALRLYLLELLRPELAPLIESVARLESHR